MLTFLSRKGLIVLLHIIFGWIVFPLSVISLICFILYWRHQDRRVEGVRR